VTAEAVPVLDVRDLGVSFMTPAGEVEAVGGISLAIQPGECLGVVGESGAGKSQAFLAVMGLLPPTARVRGSARFAGVELLGQPRHALNRVRGVGLSMVFQDPLTSLTPHLHIGDQIAESIVEHTGASWQSGRAKALQLLERVHVTDARRRMTQYPHELSGGMRQRVMIAIALACEPKLVIADEPTTALDVTIQAQILSLLAELKREQGMALVLITHDVGAVAGLADRVAVMQAGRIVEHGPVSRVLKHPEHAYTQSLLHSVPRLNGFLYFSGREGQQFKVAPAYADAPAPRKDETRAARNHPMPEPTNRQTPQGKNPKGSSSERLSPSQIEAAADGGSTSLHNRALLSLRNLGVHFKLRGNLLKKPPVVRALDDITLTINPGEVVGLVGESGSGKSTLARATLGLVRITDGSIINPGSRRDLQLVFQDPVASLDPRMTVEEIVAEPLRVHHPELQAEARDKRVEEMLLRVGLGRNLMPRYPHELSGGQAQRVGIARAMILEPKLLVCDEAVSALDVSVQAQILALLRDLKRDSDTAILFISHNLAVVQQLCDRVVVLYLGRMMEEGPTRDLYTRPAHPYTQALLAAVPIPDPDLQPGRLQTSLTGELPSPVAPPSGCVFRTRCPHAIQVCRDQLPKWEPVTSAHYVACHRWRELQNPETPDPQA
jgi:oligopeptide/dipeptide ABC transporter ATP-binding protein